MRLLALRLLGAVAPLALLSACAAPQMDKDFDLHDGPASTYGLFLAGQAALNDGRSAEAAAYFDQARAVQEDENGVVAERAFTAAVLAGDITRAAAMAPDGADVSDGGRRMGKLVSAVELMASGDGKAAVPLLKIENVGFLHRSAGALLSPWAAAMAGDVDGSLIRPQIRGDKVVEYFGLLGQAYLYERARRFDEAETDFKTLTGGDAPSGIMVLAYGGFLERRGRRDDAIALYDRALANDPGDSSLTAARTRAAGRKSAPPAPTPKEGAASALIAQAAGMAAGRQSQFALAYLRMALRLDPQRNEAWLMVGELLQDAGDIDGARQAFGRPKAGSAEYAAARAKLAWSYQAQGEGETAIRMAREGATGGGRDALITLADLLRANEQFAESAEVLSRVIGDKPDWRLLYARGVALDRAGRWPDGEKDLLAALKIRPDDPELLNYLGYSWIDRGERLTEALVMVQRAVSQNPRSGAMVDSLGWAYYRLGDYPKAVEMLENAIELEGGDPDINNHLGDAYWRVGRKDEARFQWKRVLTLEPTSQMKSEVEGKLANGLPPAPPPPVQPAVGAPQRVAEL